MNFKAINISAVIIKSSSSAGTKTCYHSYTSAPMDFFKIVFNLQNQLSPQFIATAVSCSDKHQKTALVSFMSNWGDLLFLRKRGLLWSFCTGIKKKEKPGFFLLKNFSKNYKNNVFLTEKSVTRTKQKKKITPNSTNHGDLVNVPVFTCSLFSAPLHTSVWKSGIIWYIVYCDSAPCLLNNLHIVSCQPATFPDDGVNVTSI